MAHYSFPGIHVSTFFSVWIIILSAAYPSEGLARQFPAEPIRMLEGSSAASASSMVLTDGGVLVYRDFESVMVSDGSGEPNILLAPEVEFSVAGNEYTFLGMGNFSQRALTYIRHSNQVLVRALVREGDDPQEKNVFLLLYTNGEVSQLIPRSTFGEGVDPNSSFGVCSAIGVSIDGTYRTGVSCVLPMTEEDPDVTNREAKLVFFSVDSDSDEVDSHVLPVPESAPAHPANFHFYYTISAQTMEGPIVVYRLASGLSASPLPSPASQIVAEYKCHLGTDESFLPELLDIVLSYPSSTTWPLGREGDVIEGEVVGTGFKYPIGPSTTIHHATVVREDPDTGGEVTEGFVEIESGPAISTGTSGCDCELYRNHPGGEEGIREDFSNCMGKPVADNENCQRVNFSGGDTITDSDTRCVLVCRYTIPPSKDFQVQETFRLYFARVGEPIPVHEDLLYSGFSAISGSTGHAAIAANSQTGDQVILVYKDGSFISPFRTGDDFGDGPLDRMITTGGFSNFNSKGQFTATLVSMDGSFTQRVYLISDAVTPGPDPTPQGFPDGWILTGGQ